MKKEIIFHHISNIFLRCNVGGGFGRIERGINDGKFVNISKVQVN